MRATPKRLLKTLLVIGILGFIIVNLSLLTGQQGSGGPSSEELDRRGLLPKDGMAGGLPTVSPGNQSLTRNHSIATKNIVDAAKPQPPPVDNKHQDVVKHDSVKHNTSKEVESPPSLGTNLNTSQMLSIMLDVNKQQNILNKDRFMWAEDNASLVIVVQVHNRYDYLKHLVDSLRKAKGIENALLVFSHDFYDQRINSFIHSIDFCMVMQIFYPYSIQTHPKEFPGEHPNDCPRDIKKDAAVKIKCNNADSPDKYGHYREAKYCQTKHHWFWKIHHVFDYLDVIKHFKGPVLFLEEDHYMVEDFIQVLYKMYDLRRESCTDCSILTLGTYDKNPTYGPFASKGFWFARGPVQNVAEVEITGWMSSKHNMGMSLNREVWEKIQACSTQFCTFDDYNWDWSLQFISMSCFPGKLRVMFMKSPRIYHIGECGVHHKGKNCNPAEKVLHIENLLKNNKQHLFPDKVSIHGYPRSIARMPKANGGWGDKRDHNLCLNYSSPSSHR